jgi:hypothetical protein
MEAGVPHVCQPNQQGGLVVSERCAETDMNVQQCTMHVIIASLICSCPSGISCRTKAFCVCVPCTLRPSRFVVSSCLLIIMCTRRRAHIASTSQIARRDLTGKCVACQYLKEMIMSRRKFPLQLKGLFIQREIHLADQYGERQCDFSRHVYSVPSTHYAL